MRDRGRPLRRAFEPRVVRIRYHGEIKPHNGHAFLATLYASFSPCSHDHRHRYAIPRHANIHCGKPGVRPHRFRSVAEDQARFPLPVGHGSVSPQKKLPPLCQYINSEEIQYWYQRHSMVLAIYTSKITFIYSFFRWCFYWEPK